MGIKALVCPSCGCKIENLDSGTKEAFCPYCNCIIEDVPDLQIQYELHSKNDVLDAQIDQAKNFFRLKEYESAAQICYQYIDAYPDLNDGWLLLFDIGLVTQDLSIVRRAYKNLQTLNGANCVSTGPINLIDRTQNILREEFPNFEAYKREYEENVSKANKLLSEKKKISAKSRRWFFIPLAIFDVVFVFFFALAVFGAIPLNDFISIVPYAVVVLIIFTFVFFYLSSKKQKSSDLDSELQLYLDAAQNSRYAKHVLFYDNLLDELRSL